MDAKVEAKLGDRKHALLMAYMTAQLSRAKRLPSWSAIERSMEGEKEPVEQTPQQQIAMAEWIVFAFGGEDRRAAKH